MVLPTWQNTCTSWHQVAWKMLMGDRSCRLHSFPFWAMCVTALIYPLQYSLRSNDFHQQSFPIVGPSIGAYAKASGTTRSVSNWRRWHDWIKHASCSKIALTSSSLNSLLMFTNYFSGYFDKSFVVLPGLKFIWKSETLICQNSAIIQHFAEITG